MENKKAIVRTYKGDEEIELKDVDKRKRELKRRGFKNVHFIF